jgi:site-specific recombinase XerD
MFESPCSTGLMLFIFHWRRIMTITEAVDKFLVGYFGTSSRSMKTRSAYTFDLGQFRDFLGREASLRSVDAEALEAWARNMQSTPYAIASIRRKFAAARMFFNYWVRRGDIDASPMWRLRLSLGREQALPRSLSPSDSRLLIEQAWHEEGRAPSTHVTSSVLVQIPPRDRVGVDND